MLTPVKVNHVRINGTSMLSVECPTDQCPDCKGTGSCDCGTCPTGHCLTCQGTGSWTDDPDGVYLVDMTLVEASKILKRKNRRFTQREAY